MKILIGIDLTQMYYTTKKLRLQIDYGELIQEVKRASTEPDEEYEVLVVGFTKYSERNTGQADFVENLREAGIDVRTFPITHTGGFDANILAEAMTVDADEVIIVSNTTAAFEAAERLMSDDGAPALVASIAYFSEDVPPAWLPKLLARKKLSFSFLDLSDQDVKQRIRKKYASAA